MGSSRSDPAPLKRARLPRHRQAMSAAVAATMMALAAACALAEPAEKGARVIATVVNPDPAALPTLGVWQRDNLILVSAAFPEVADFTCDSWCYESAVDFLDARDLGGGRLELRHRVRDQPHVLLVTTVTPEPGAVEFAARVEVDPQRGGELPANPLVPNLCWQLMRAPAFASAPEPYLKFVKRCFIFTAAGLTTLDRTERRKIPCRADDDLYNNPPWVQMYLRVGQPQPQVPATAWADYSPDRYTVPIIGALSRDGKRLAALANGAATMMAQAWHDCMHNNPPWLPADAAPEKRLWRVKVYIMDNDPAALLARVARDFPR